MQPKFRRIPLDQLIVDRTDEGGYQRAAREDLALKIAENFDPHLFEPIHISQRGDDKYAIIEGQTRYLAALLMEHPDMTAMVHTGLTREDEARLFVELATEHSRLSAGQESRETSVAVELLKLYNKGRRTGRIGEALS